MATNRAGTAFTVHPGAPLQRGPAPRSRSRGRSPLRGTGFGQLWLSTGAANLGDGLLLAGLPVLATTVTDAPVAIAGITVSLVLPMVLTALPGGAVTDRADRRRILILGNAGRAAALLILLLVIAALDVRLALLYAIGVAVASSEVLVDTTAQTTVPSLVPGDRLDGVNARLMVTQIVGNDAVGAPIGAALATLGAVALLGPGALLYGAAAVAAHRLRLPIRYPASTTAAGGQRARTTTVRAEIVHGLVHLRSVAVLRRLAVANALSNLGNTAFGAVAVLYVIGPLDLPATAYGGLLAALGGGALLGGTVAERLLARVGSLPGIRGALAVATGCYVTLAVAPQVAVVAAAAALLGAASMLVNVACRTLRQRLVPDALLGRVTASMAAVALVATPVGAVVGGLGAQWLGVVATAWIAAATNLGAVLLMSERRWRRCGPYVPVDVRRTGPRPVPTRSPERATRPTWT